VVHDNLKVEILDVRSQESISVIGIQDFTLVADPLDIILFSENNLCNIAAK